MNQTKRANKVNEICVRNDFISKGVSAETADEYIKALRKATDESFELQWNNRFDFRAKFPKRETVLGDIPDYKNRKIRDEYGDKICGIDDPGYWADARIDDETKRKWENKGTRRRFLLRNYPILEVRDDLILLSEYESDLEDHYERCEKRIDSKRKAKAAKAYLATPFVKGWLRKMQYTERVDEYGHTFLFIAIKCGYGKISDEVFQRICNAICTAAYEDELRMNMWIGGKVNWTMFYQRPDHVDGHETFFCGVVGKDDFSPEDWDRDHSKYSFENADKY